MDNKIAQEKLIIFLCNQRDLLIRSIDQAKAARDSAPSAMESHSDTTRSEKEKPVSALETEKNTIDNYIKSAQKTDPEYLELKSEGLSMEILLVPAGMGGKKINNLFLLGTDSPLGKVVAGKKLGEEVQFNGRKWRVC